MNAKKIVKNHMNKMLACMNESILGDDKQKMKESKFDGNSIS